MKKLCLVSFLLLLPILAIVAQQKVSIHLEQGTAAELFNMVEKQTGCKIYYQPEKADSLLVTVNVTDEDLLTALKTALQGSTLEVSRYEDIIFVTDNVGIITSLPENYFENKISHGDDDQYNNLLFQGIQTKKAVSESKVYEIGDPSVTPAGKVSLSGIITDFKTGEPLIGLTLSIKEPQTGVVSDAFGYYTINIPPGHHDLYIQGIGHKDTRRQILLHSDGKLDIEIEEDIYALKEVVVSAERVANVRSTTMGVERLKIKDIKNIPMAFGEVDIIRVVMALPGVKSVGEASSGFNVRGGATDQNLILFNDGTVYNPTHLFGFFSAFNPDLVKDMELYKSSIPVRYGGRISSVLDITTRDGNKKEFNGSASLGLLTSRLTLEGPLFSEKTSYIVGGRTTYSNWILKQLPEKSGYKDSRAGFYDLNASLNHKFDEYNNLYVNGYFSSDRFSFDSHEKYSYRNANASIKWRHIFSPVLTSVLTAGYDHYDYDTKNNNDSINAYKLLFGINQYFTKADFNWYPAHNHTINFGAGGTYYNLNPGEYLPSGNESFVIPDYMQKEKGLETFAYLGDNWNITSRLSVSAGIRYSMFNVLGPRKYNEYQSDYLPSLSTIVENKSVGKGSFRTYHGPEYRISTRYEFVDNFSVKAGFNTMRQNIHKISNTTVMSPTDTWKLSDANIKPQKGKQVALGLYKNYTDRSIELSLEGYYKTMNDYLDYRSGAELLMNHSIETDVLSTEGRAYGVEFMLKKTQGKLNGWVSYTYSRTQLRQNDERIEHPVNGGSWYSADYDKPHDIKFVGNYKFTHRYSLSMNCDYSTGRPITLPVSKYNYVGGEYVYFSERNSYRIPDFFRVDLSFNIEPSHHLTLLTHSMISFGVYNLTGRKNAYSIYYISERGHLKGYKLAIFGSPIPYVSYNIKF